MNNFFEWFSSGLKLKRWFLLILIGVFLISYSTANYLISDELSIPKLILYGILFVIGFCAVIMSFVMSQRRILQAIAEVNANPNGRNINLKKLLFDKRMLDKNIKVVAIGDGDGLATLLKGLKIFSNNVTAIVNVIDNEKRINENVSVQDVKKAMAALSNKEDVFEDFFEHRITSGDLKGKNLGNTFFELLSDMCDNNLSKTIEYMSKLLAMRGTVIPVTLDNVTIGTILNDGTRVIGKRNIMQKVEERRAAIENVFLVPERCVTAPDVIRSIKEADVIIIGPGSLYSGIIPTLLIREVSDAIRKSKACKIFVANIMTEKNQTDNFALSDYINAIHEHVGKDLFDYCICSDSDIMPEFIRRYNKEGSDLVEIDRSKLRGMNAKLIVDDLATIDEKNYIRHNSLKLAQNIFRIVCDNMDLENNERAIEYYTAKNKIDKIARKRKKKSILFSDVKIITNTKKKRK